MNSHLTVQDIFIYPIKSLGGVRLEEAWAEEKGLQYDRRWMLVSEDGNFISQREYPYLALLQIAIAHDSLLVFDKKNRSSQIRIPFEQFLDEKIEVTIWDDQVTAVKVGTEFDRWFSEKLGINVFLVKMPETTLRKVDPKYAKNGETVSFADGMPYLIIGQSSLDDLNSKLENPVPMNRFRPNIVFSGGKAFDEDKMYSIRIGDLEFSIIKPCARCVLTTVDQNSGKKGKEPLKTLSSYRTSNNKVLFGQNMVAMSVGKIYVGDPIIVMD
ncbi:MOSC N-terminal beta barrel domain-containing protein [Algoriphagus sp.]|uniref:MOSC domain-containing protein n=1 Tax=Algoriphagus sp. TaxID=1872435 RepID=UPI0025F0065C|nr:MOSC N-terminal beta barrel domain-containing protein [Algoriphagus sp.]